MAPLDLRRHWLLAAGVLVLDVVLVGLTIFLDKQHHVEPPAAGSINTSAPIGWLGVCGAIFIFGCYGILIKTPSVQEAQCDCMVFQCYSSLAVVAMSLAIWSAAGGGVEGPTLDSSSLSMGVLFGTLWIVTGVCAYNAVQAIGYAVAPAIWIGVTICTSFLWGVAVFHNPVRNWSGAIGALLLMVLGVILAVASGMVSDRQEDPGAHEAVSETVRGDGALLSSGGGGGSSSRARARVRGILYACLLGLCNGSLMVCLSCFQDGCPAIGVQAYTGSILAPLAFLPSLAAGVAIAHPVLFLMYWGPSMWRGTKPQFHVSRVALPALLTGSFWCMGNFSAMFATVYLGQTVGFPLTQCCLIISGICGILYFKEIKGLRAIGMFVAASVIIIAGATLDGLSC